MTTNETVPGQPSRREIGMHGYKVLTEAQLDEILRLGHEDDIYDLVSEIRRLNQQLRMANERAAIACRERDEAVTLNQAMSRVLAEYRDGYVYCEQHGHEQQEPCPRCAEENR